MKLICLSFALEAFDRFIELELQDADAVFSDNYFDLSSGYIN